MPSVAVSLLVLIVPVISGHLCLSKSRNAGPCLDQLQFPSFSETFSQFYSLYPLLLPSLAQSLWVSVITKLFSPVLGSI